jgi:CBS domain-containing protein
VVTDRDICYRVVGAGKDPANTVRAIMTSIVTCCFEDQDCKEAARLMKDKGVRRLTVVDRKQAMLGFSPSMTSRGAPMISPAACSKRSRLGLIDWQRPSLKKLCKRQLRMACGLALEWRGRNQPARGAPPPR